MYNIDPNLIRNYIKGKGFDEYYKTIQDNVKKTISKLEDMDRLANITEKLIQELEIKGSFASKEEKKLEEILNKNYENIKVDKESIENAKQYGDVRNLYELLKDIRSKIDEREYRPLSNKEKELIEKVMKDDKLLDDDEVEGIHKLLTINEFNRYKPKEPKVVSYKPKDLELVKSRDVYQGLDQYKPFNPGEMKGMFDIFGEIFGGILNDLADFTGKMTTGSKKTEEEIKEVKEEKENKEEEKKE